jgi:hypothetical protein
MLIAARSSRARRHLVLLSVGPRGPKTLVVLAAAPHSSVALYEVLHLVTQRPDVETATEPEGPRQCTSPFGEIQTGQGGVQVRTSPWEPAVQVEQGDPLLGVFGLAQPGNHPHHV